MRALTGAGVPCGVLLMPILPFINDTPENIRAVVRRAADAGASWIYAGPGFGVTLRDNQREYFYDRLDEAFPACAAATPRPSASAMPASLPGTRSCGPCSPPNAGPPVFSGG